MCQHTISDASRSPATSQPPAAAPSRGFRLQRHVAALYSTPTHFAENKKQRAKVATGITIQYAIHTSEVPGATETEHVVMIMGLRQRMEWWAPNLDVLLPLWASSSGGSGSGGSGGSPTKKKKKNLTIVTFDNRGIGGTDAHWGRYTTSQMAHDTLALMDHLAWPTAHIVGVSMGGMIAMELALAASPRVKSLSLLATTRGRYQFVSEKQAPVYMTLVGASSHPAIVAPCALWIMHSEVFLARKMEEQLATATTTTIKDVLYDYYAYRLESLQQPHVVGAIGQVLAVASHYVSDERLAAIGRAGFPVLIMGGGRDRVIPWQESETLAAFITGNHVRLVRVEDASHGITVEYMDEVAHELIHTIHRSSFK